MMTHEGQHTVVEAEMKEKERPMEVKNTIKKEDEGGNLVEKMELHVVDTATITGTDETQKLNTAPAPPDLPNTAAGQPQETQRQQSGALGSLGAVGKMDMAASTYCSREQLHIERERRGEVSSMYVMNDGLPESGKTLIGLKNIFSKCLPNMPKTYIARLVFDRRHRSVVIKRKNGKVLAGITYRPFYEKRFAEIAFCAVAQTLQVSGFGTRLMNWTKYYARERDGCEYFLTYADNAAVGYFAKQGFTKFQTMARERWFGYIKDYDGGTLMECYIHPTLPYENIPGFIESQKSYLESDVRQISNASVVHPGMTRWQENSQAAPLALQDIPGVSEAGWTMESHTASQPVYRLKIGHSIVNATPENMKKLQLWMLDQLANEEIAWPFLEPVSIEQVPDYLDLIKNPIDIGTIRKDVQAGTKYITMDIFIADVMRIFKNAKIYNAQESVYYKYAHKLSILFQQLVNNTVLYDI